MYRKIFFLLFLSFFNFISNAQVCDDVVNVCSNQPLQNLGANSPAPFGITVNCGAGDINFSTQRVSWYRVRIESGNQFTFVIDPQITTNPNANLDYDFVVYGPNPDCDNLGTARPIRASYAGPGANPDTGLSTGVTDTCEDASGDGFVSAIDVRPGEEYIIMIDRFTSDASNFNINWNVGTSAVLDCSIVVGDLGPDQRVCEGTQIDLDGEPANPTVPIASYQWQLSTDGGTNYSDISGATNSILTINNDVSGMYRVIITDTDGTMGGENEVVEIAFVPPPSADTIPNPEQCAGDTFTIEATNIANADTFIWQESQDNGTTWNNLSNDATFNNVDTAILTINNVGNFNGRQYRLNMSNSATDNDCINNTNVVTLTVNPLPTADAIANLNQCETDTFTIDAVNVTNADTFQWQVSQDSGTTWETIDSALEPVYSNENTSSLTITNVPNGFDGFQYQVILTNSTTTCSSTSNAATLTIRPLPTANTIVDVNRCENDTFTIDVTATNANTYTWQVSTDGGTTWGNVDSALEPAYSNETTASLAIANVPQTFDGYQYRVNMSNTDASNCDSFSNATTLTVNPLPVANTINDFNQCENDTFTITATATNADVYFWQVSEDGGTTWDNIVASANYSNETTASLTITNVPDTFDGYQYRVNMSNAAVANCNSLSNATTLTVNRLPVANTIADLTQCETDTFTIDVTATNANTYTWQVSTDGGTSWNDIDSTVQPIYSNENTASLTITNVINDFNNNQYRVSMSNTNATSCNSNSNPITLTVNPLPIINTMVELEQCDDDTDGFSLFNLTEANTLLSTNSANETFTYYPTLADANAGTNAISNNPADPINVFAYQNSTVATSIIAVRVTNATTFCYRTTELLLTVSTTQIPASYSRDFFACDDFLDINGNNNANNDDTDGVTSFDFSSVKAEVEAFFISSGQTVTATFYRNEADALAETNEITDTANYRNIGYPNTQQIYVRVDSDIDNGCLGLGPYVNLTVTPVPIANPINADNELTECDDYVDGNPANGIAEFNLGALRSTILGSQSPTAYTVSFHDDAADATSGANPLPDLYRNNSSPNRQTIYVRVAGNGCAFDRYTFDLVVESLPISNSINMANTDLICDDNDDGSATNGFVQSIDLESYTADILGTTQDPNDYIVTYHTTLALAQSNGTNITGLHTNDTNPDRIYVRIESRATGCVNDTFNFDIEVVPEPLGFRPSNLSECDDDTDGDDANGFIQSFDLNGQIPAILGNDPTVQDPDDFNVTFYHTQAEATAGNVSDQLPTPYTNRDQGGNTIYVRIENRATGCVNDDVNFEVEVYQLPTFSVTPNQVYCGVEPLVLFAENANIPFNGANYQWTNADTLDDLGISESLSVTAPGRYTITIIDDSTSERCGRSETITVTQSSLASLDPSEVIIDDAIYIDNSFNRNSITVPTQGLGTGDYEFALVNGETGVTIRDYQDDNVFNDIEGGVYIIKIRDKNGCGVFTSSPIPVIEFPKFFTPNGDGIKDTWTIKGLNSTFYPGSKIFIFNRQGKVISEVDPDGPGWNGTYQNNNPVPSDDYWYRIVILDSNGQSFDKKGHFSLLRR